MPCQRRAASGSPPGPPFLKPRLLEADDPFVMVASAAGGALIVLLGLYFVPSIVGAVRKVPNIGSVVVLNFFLGWTIIGWVVALAMAARSVPARA
jgi:hypothetical protein